MKKEKKERSLDSVLRKNDGGEADEARQGV